MIRNKKKYIVVFLMKENKSYTIEAKRKIKSNTKTITYRNTPYVINTVNYSFSNGLNLYYYISLTEKTQLFFENSKDLQIGIKAIDMILNDEIIAQITSNLNKSNFSMNLFNIIFSALFGGLVGFLIGGYV